MSVTPGEFIEECADQQIGLSPKLITRMQHYLRDKDLIRTIEETNKVIFTPPYQVAERPLEKAYWGTEFLPNVLGRMINGRLVQLDEGIVKFPVSGDKTIQTCSDAELAFTRAFTNIFRQRGEREMLFDQAGCEIFEKDGTPLFMRKGILLPSALSLQEIAIDGISYPAGSIFRIDTHKDVKRVYPFVDRDTLKIVPTTKIAKIAFMRLSMFALPPEERQSAFGGADYFDHKYSNMENVIAHSDMSELVEVSEVLIEYAKPSRLVDL